jgi:Asp-tRNA(Asn)/Glu-tRNA(Gln) amidotransferase A subunit family amidase
MIGAATHLGEGVLMRGFTDFERYDGLGLAELVRRHEVKPAEILEAAIGRIEERNLAVNAVVTRLYDQARAAIVAGLPSGPFTGVPYLLKDLGVLCAGAATSFGSAFFAGVVADHDSEITARLKRAGLVILGKSNTPELGLAPSTEPRLFGPTRNPWNLAYSAGGSSGGAAAALLTPTMCQPPYPIGVLNTSSDDESAYLAALLASIGFTSLFNSSGNPAMSVPLAWSRSGLPLGVQFAARFGEESTLLRLGAQLEAAQPWADRRPSLAG